MCRLFVGMVGYGVGVASVAMATCGMQSVLHTHRRLCSNLCPHSQTNGVKWEHVCADQCAGCRWWSELAQVLEPEVAVYADDPFSIIIDMLQVCLAC